MGVRRMPKNCGYLVVCWNRSVSDMHLLRNLELLKVGLDFVSSSVRGWWWLWEGVVYAVSPGLRDPANRMLRHVPCARVLCGMWFSLKPRWICSNRLAALSFSQYIIIIMILILDFLILENSTHSLSRNVVTKLQFYAALNDKIAQLSFAPRRKTELTHHYHPSSVG